MFILELPSDTVTDNDISRVDKSTSIPQYLYLIMVIDHLGTDNPAPLKVTSKK